MTATELDAVIRGIVPVVRGYLASELAPRTAQYEALAAKVAMLEARPIFTAELRDSMAESALAMERRLEAVETMAAVPGPTGERGPQGERGELGEPGPQGVAGQNGKDAPPIDLEAVAMRAATLIPRPKDGRDGMDGKDAPAVDLEALAVRAAALVPRPKDGRDGTDGKDAPPVDLDDLALRAADLIPKPKDGTDGKDGRDGQPGVPGVPGRDGERGERGEQGLHGKDGRDGTLEGARLEQIDERSWRLVRADGSALPGVFKAPSVLDRGVYQAGHRYEKGDGVTYGGSFWIAQDETSDKPGDGATAWRLAVKHGRDGREGKEGKQGPPAASVQETRKQDRPNHDIETVRRSEAVKRAAPWEGQGRRE